MKQIVGSHLFECNFLSEARLIDAYATLTKKSLLYVPTKKDCAVFTDTTEELMLSSLMTPLSKDSSCFSSSANHVNLLNLPESLSCLLLLFPHTLLRLLVHLLFLHLLVPRLHLFHLLLLLTFPHMILELTVWCQRTRTAFPFPAMYSGTKNNFALPLYRLKD